jgi:hypothetical protein
MEKCREDFVHRSWGSASHTFHGQAHRRNTQVFWLTPWPKRPPSCSPARRPDSCFSDCRNICLCRRRRRKAHQMAQSLVHDDELESYRHRYLKFSARAEWSVNRKCEPASGAVSGARACTATSGYADGQEGPSCRARADRKPGQKADLVSRGPGTCWSGGLRAQRQRVYIGGGTKKLAAEIPFP